MAENVREVRNEEAIFNFQVQISGMSVHVIKNREGGPIIIGLGMELSSQQRQIFNNIPDPEKEEFLSSLTPILTVAPGIYRFLDRNGRDTNFVNLHSIRIEDRLYPDGANQNSLMKSIFGLLKVGKQLQRLMNDFLSEVQR